MCGLAGIIARPGGHLPVDWIDRALARQAHRGPDGAASCGGSDWAMGHCRLAVFDLDPRANQPFRYREVTLIFNGAIYNFPELRAELRRLGYLFTTESDSEVVAAAYLAWGTACVERFNGMWALALYDATRRILFCSRDRYGIKPFYYCARTAFFAFASEIKALLSLPALPTGYSALRLGEFLLRGWLDHSPDTLFTDIVQLPAGHNLTYDFATGNYQLDRYYTPGHGGIFSSNDLSRAEAIAGIYHRLSASIDLRLRADVACTLTLSGGLDSSTLAALIAQRQAGFPVFSVVFQGPSYDESDFTQATVAKLGLRPHYLRPTAADFTTYLDRTLYQQEVPLASAAVVAHHQLMATIHAAGYKVVLGGQGADEILAGYHKFYGPWLRQCYQQSAGEALAASWRIFWRQPAYFLWQWERVQRFLAPPPARAVWLHPHLQEAVREQGFQRSGDHTVRDCSLNLLSEVGLPILLHHEDRNAMAYGMESRLPFLDYRLVDYCLSLPDEYKLQGGRRKSLLLDAMQDRLPAALLCRRDKLGFASPQNEWMDITRATIIREIGTLPLDWPQVFRPKVYDWCRAVLERRAYGSYPTVWRIWMAGRWLQRFF